MLTFCRWNLSSKIAFSTDVLKWMDWCPWCIDPLRKFELSAAGAGECTQHKCFSSRFLKIKESLHSVSFRTFRKICSFLCLMWCFRIFMLCLRDLSNSAVVTFHSDISSYRIYVYNDCSKCFDPLLSTEVCTCRVNSRC